MLLAEAQAAAARWGTDLGALVNEVNADAEADGQLAGLTAGVKDVIAVAGTPRLLGVPGATDGRPADRDAVCVRRLRQAGAAILATTQTHALACGAITPQTRNPRAPGRVAGGSSGGSAAAVAAGIVDVALGTDTAGSVRIPAACCGVVGLKTTRGAIPLLGVQPLAWSLDTVGPLARSVADCAAVFDSLAGPCRDDPTSLETWAPSGPPERLRVGVPRETLDDAVDPQVRRAWTNALAALEDDGVLVVTVDIPELVGAGEACGTLLIAEAAAEHAALMERVPDAVPHDVRTRLEYGAGLAATTLARAHWHGARLRWRVRRAFASVDVLVVPTLPGLVPPVGARTVDVDGREEGTTAALTRLTSPWNLAGLPAGSVPIAVDADGAPIAAQVVGPGCGEPAVLAAMALIERQAGGPRPAVKPPEPPDLG